MTKRKIYTRGADRNVHEYLGYIVPEDRGDGFDLAVFKTRTGVYYQNIDTWQVIDRPSGLAVCGGETPKEAIQKTLDHFADVGIKAVREKLNRFMEENGTMPGYEDDFRY